MEGRLSRWRLSSTTTSPAPSANRSTFHPVKFDAVKPKKFSKSMCSGRVLVPTTCLLICLREVDFLYQVAAKHENWGRKPSYTCRLSIAIGFCWSMSDDRTQLNQVSSWILLNHKKAICCLEGCTLALH